MHDFKLYQLEQNCCGCGACKQICTKHAIFMKNNKDGFKYPVIDWEHCINCGLCYKACRFQKDIKKKEKGELILSKNCKVYVAVSEITDLKQSASGGIFSGIAKAVLASGGVVFGAEMVLVSGQLILRHVGIESEEDMIRLQGSKYVQSDLGDCYVQIRSLLKKGKNVLFSGTPCQVAGLYGYLGGSHKNLYTIDIICHGVPSEKMFHDYLKYIELKRKAKIIEFKFRDKALGWRLLGSMVLKDVTGKQNKYTFKPEKSSYYQMFLNSYTYRENCYQCPYAGGERPGNITIGDFWCVELVHPEICIENGGDLDYEKGASCLIINDSKGQELINIFGIGIKMWKSDYEHAAQHNGQLRCPSALKPERKIVFQMYAEGYEKVEKWYRKRQCLRVIRRTIRRAVPRPLKNVIKKILGQ